MGLIAFIYTFIPVREGSCFPASQDVRRNKHSQSKEGKMELNAGISMGKRDYRVLKYDTETHLPKSGMYVYTLT